MSARKPTAASHRMRRRASPRNHHLTTPSSVITGTRATTTGGARTRRCATGRLRLRCWSPCPRRSSALSSRTTGRLRSRTTEGARRHTRSGQPRRAAVVLLLHGGGAVAQHGTHVIELTRRHEYSRLSARRRLHPRRGVPRGTRALRLTANGIPACGSSGNRRHSASTSTATMGCVRLWSRQLLRRRR